MMSKVEIKGETEIRQMVDSFYDKVNQDELLSPIFNDFSNVNWQTHLPSMYKFWGSVLLGQTDYKGSPFLKHIPLPINNEHFERWIHIFVQNIDEQFYGPLAEEAKARAKSIADIFSFKLAHIRKQQNTGN